MRLMNHLKYEKADSFGVFIGMKYVFSPISPLSEELKTAAPKKLSISMMKPRHTKSLMMSELEVD